MASRTLDIKINLEALQALQGTDKLNKALEGLGKSQKVSAESSDKLNKSKKDLTKTLKDSSEQSTKTKLSFDRLMIGLNQSLEVVKKVAAGLAKGFDSTVGQAIKLNSAIAEIETLLDDTAGAQQQFTKEILAFQRQFGADQTTTAKAYYDAISSGAVDATTAQELLTVANKLAIGGVTDVGTAVNGLTSIINAYGFEAEDSTKISDSLFIAMKAGKTTIAELSSSIGGVAPLAATMNVTIDETLAIMSGLTTAGLGTAEATTQLRATLSNLVKPTADMQEAMKKLGIESIQTAIEQDGLVNTINALVGTTDGSAESIGKLFGSVQAIGAVSAITSDAVGSTINETFKAMGDAAVNAGAVSEEAFQKIAQSTEFQVKRMKANWEALTTQLGVALIPTVNKVVEAGLKAVEMLQGTIDWISKNRELVIALGSALGVVAGAYAGYTIAINAARIASIALNAALTIKAALLAAIASPVVLVTAAVAALTAGIVYWYRNTEIVNAYIKQTAGILLDTFEPAVELVIKAFYEWRRGFDLVGGSLLLLISNMMKVTNFISSVLLAAFDGVLRATSAIVGIFNKELAGAVDTAREKLQSFNNTVKAGIDAAEEQAKSMINTARSSENYTKKKDDAIKASKELTKNLKNESAATIRVNKENKEAQKETEKLEKKKAALNDVTADTIDLVKEQAKQEAGLKKKIEETEDTLKEYSSAQKAYIDDMKAMQASQKAAIEEERKYKEQLAQTRAEIEKMQDTANRLPEAYRIIQIDEELNSIATILGAEKTALAVIEAQRLESLGKVEEAELKIAQIRAEASQRAAVQQLSDAGAQDPTTEKGSIFANIQEGFKKAADISVAVFKTGANLYKDAISAANQALKAGMDILSGSFVTSVDGILKGFGEAPGKFLSNLNALEGTLNIFDTEGLEEAKKLAEKNLEVENKKLENIQNSYSLLDEQLAQLKKEEDALKKEGEEKLEQLKKQEQAIKDMNEKDKAQLAARLSAIELEKAELKLREGITKEELKEKTDRLNAEKKFLQDNLNAYKEDRVDQRQLLSEQQEQIKAEIKEKTEQIKAQQEQVKAEVNEKKELLKEQEKALDETRKASEEAAEKFAQGFEKAIMQLVDKIPVFVDKFISALPKIIDKLKAAFPKVIAKIIEAIPQIIESLINALDAIFPVIVDGLVKAVLAIIPELPKIIQAVVRQIPVIIRALGKIIPALIREIPSIIRAILDELPSIIHAIIEALPDIIEAIIIAIPDIIFAIIEALPSIIMALVTGIIGNLPNILKALWKGLLGVLGNIANWITTNIFDKVFGVFVKPFQWVIDNIFLKVFDWFIAPFQWVWENIFQKAFNIFIAPFQWVWENIFQKAFSIFTAPFVWVKEKIFDPIISAFQRVIDAAKSAISAVTSPVKTVTSSIKKVFGFNQGGFVGGREITKGDSPRNDIVPAMLSPGEIVIPKSAVNGGMPSMINFLDKLTNVRKYHAGGRVQAFSGGGKVQSSTGALLFNDMNMVNAISELKSELRTVGYQVAKNTLQTNRILERYEYMGLPVREFE